jgi:hypothetical protein
LGVLGESTEPYLPVLGKISGASRMIKQSPEKSTTFSDSKGSMVSQNQMYLPMQLRRNFKAFGLLFGCSNNKRNNNKITSLKYLTKFRTFEGFKYDVHICKTFFLLRHLTPT